MVEVPKLTSGTTRFDKTVDELVRSEVIYAQTLREYLQANRTIEHSLYESFYFGGVEKIIHPMRKSYEDLIGNLDRLIAGLAEASKLSEEEQEKKLATTFVLFSQYLSIAGAAFAPFIDSYEAFQAHTKTFQVESPKQRYLAKLDEVIFAKTNQRFLKYNLFLREISETAKELFQADSDVLKELDHLNGVVANMIAKK